jgi:serine/threonine protein kinase
VVRVHDLRKIDEEYFIVMEYIDGIDLAQAIYVHQQHSLRFPLSIFFHIALSLCEALEFAHSALDFDGRPIQLIHRDIKPSNVLIHHRGVVKLTDFGIAYVGDATHTGSIVKGTANYMSPEQASGEEKLTPASDIFSLGAVFWEMLTLSRLVDGTNYLNVIHSIRELNVGLKDISKRGIEPGLRMILLRMLARKRELRYQSMGLVLKDLRFVAEQMKVDLSPSHLREYMAKITNLARQAPVDPSQTLAGKQAVSPQVMEDTGGSVGIPEASKVTPPRGRPVVGALAEEESTNSFSSVSDLDLDLEESTIGQFRAAQAEPQVPVTAEIPPLAPSASRESNETAELEPIGELLPGSVSLATEDLERQLFASSSRSQPGNLPTPPRSARRPVSTRRRTTKRTGHSSLWYLAWSGFALFLAAVLGGFFAFLFG